MSGFLRSTRFIIIQEGLFLGFVASLLSAALVPQFPIKDFLLFLAPVTLGAYGIKTFQHVKTENGTSEKQKIPD